MDQSIRVDPKLLVMLAVIALTACATAPEREPAARPGPAAEAKALAEAEASRPVPAGAFPPEVRAQLPKFACLSYTLPCGKVPTRQPVKQELAGPLNGDVARGTQIAMTRGKGNCIACHVLQGGVQPGTVGPDLSRYASFGRSDAETYALIYDMRWRNPDALMPPFGTNQVLTDQELRDVAAFMQSQK